MLDYKTFGVGLFPSSGPVVRTKRTPMTQFDTLSNDSLDVLTLPVTEPDPKTGAPVEVITIITDVPQRNVLIPSEPLENGDAPGSLLCHLKEYPAGTVAYTAGTTHMYQKDVSGRWIDFDTKEVVYSEGEDEEGSGGALNDGSLD